MTETLQSIVALQKEEPEVEQRVTLLTFSSNKLNYVFDNTPASQITSTEVPYHPNGCTPLYDAIGNSISKVYAACAEDEVAIVTIITDGEENASREFQLSDVKRLIEKQRKAGWTVALIGTDNLDVKGMAHSMAIDDHLTFHQDAETTARAFSVERKARKRALKSIMETGCAPCEAFFENDKV